MTIEIFVTPNCPRCRYLEGLLDEAGLKYTEVDISAGFGPLKRCRKISGKALVPVVVSGEEWWPATTPDLAEKAVGELRDRLDR